MMMNDQLEITKTFDFKKVFKEFNVKIPNNNNEKKNINNIDSQKKKYYKNQQSNE